MRYRVNLSRMSILNMDNLFVLILHHDGNGTTSNVLEYFQAYLASLRAKPLTIEKEMKALNEHYFTITVAKNSSVKLLHLAD